jgi:hypothetical protein
MCLITGTIMISGRVMSALEEELNGQQEYSPSLTKEWILMEIICKKRLFSTFPYVAALSFLVASRRKPDHFPLFIRSSSGRGQSFHRLLRA